MRKTAFLIIIITTISKIIGLGRELVLSYIFGATNISDAYLISITIPTVIFSVILAGLEAGYIPIYSSIKERKGDELANNFTNNLISILIYASSLIIIIIFVFANDVVRLFASGFAIDTFEIAVNFTRITIISIYFFMLVTIFSGFLRVHNKHILPNLIGFPFNLIIVFSFIYASKYSLYFLPIGYLIASASKFLVLIPQIKTLNYKHKFLFNLRDEGIINIVRVFIPVILGVSVNEINILVDRTLASKIAVGGISALNYASKLNGFVLAIFVLSIVSVSYPKLSMMISKNSNIGFKKTLSEIISAISILVVPVAVGTIIFSHEIIILLFARGAFDSTAAQLTSNALFFYSFGMLGFGFREALSRAFYSMHDSKTPMLNAFIGVIVNIILNIILSRFLGIGGLALATSISATFTTVLLFAKLRKKIGPFGMKQISISFLKILFASSIMGLLAKLSFNYLTASLSQNLSLLLAIGVGAVSYFVIIYFMKIEDVDVIVGAIKKKFGRGAA